MIRAGLPLALRLPCGAQATYFLPIEAGNRWVYVHEVVDGSSIGEGVDRVLAVEVTPASFERRDDVTR